jgi:outer membrane lipoprotein SlyB
MGLLGSQLGSLAGGGIGGAIGQKYGGSTGQKAGQEIGSVLGKVGGAFLPFKKGGKVVKSTQKALLHKGEIVVPAKLTKHLSKSLKDKIKANGGYNM